MAKGKINGRSGEIGNWKLKEIADTGPEKEGKKFYYNVNFGDYFKIYTYIKIPSCIH